MAGFFPAIHVLACCASQVVDARLFVREDGASRLSAGHDDGEGYEHPVVDPHVSHFMQVPLRTSVKLPHSPQASPS
jgi:hypothetical protein